MFAPSYCATRWYQTLACGAARLVTWIEGIDPSSAARAVTEKPVVDLQLKGLLHLAVDSQHRLIVVHASKSCPGCRSVRLGRIEDRHGNIHGSVGRKIDVERTRSDLSGYPRRTALQRCGEAVSGCIGSGRSRALVELPMCDLDNDRPVSSAPGENAQPASTEASAAVVDRPSSAIVTSSTVEPSSRSDICRWLKDILGHRRSIRHWTFRRVGVLCAPTGVLDSGISAEVVSPAPRRRYIQRTLPRARHIG